MKTNFISLIIFIFLWALPLKQLHSQCLVAPVATCSTTAPLVTDGETLNEGTSKWYYGPVAIFNSLKLNGGTLTVCGNLTIDRFEMDSGKIFVQPGGRLVIGNGIGAGLVFRGNCYLYNYGTLEVLRNLSLENGWASAARPNVVINATRTSIFKMNNQYFVINNAHSKFVNKGLAYFHGLITDPQASVGSVCLGKASETVMTVLYNKVKNSYIAPEAYACVSVSEFSQLWDTLSTLNPYIRVCLGLTHRLDSGCMIYGCRPSWGMADIFRGCLGCNAISVLANRFISFAVLPFSNVNRLYWEMENYRPEGIFIIEASRDGIQFQPLHTMAAVESSNKNYRYHDAGPPGGREYYRVKYTDTITRFSVYSPVVALRKKQSASFSVYPNPFHDRVWLSLPGEHTAVTALVTNMYGAVISRQQLSQVSEQWQIRLPAHFPTGLYLLTVTAGAYTWNQKIMKQ